MASSSSSSPEISASHSRKHADPPSMQARLHEILEDLSSRFILNLPDEELASLERVCFQVEQAHWYYEDFVREQDPSFPTMSLKKFSNSLFHVCPLLSHWGDDHEQTFQNFMAYKTRVPVCGAIMLNETWDKCLLVKGWKATAAWSFPKGKINEQEERHRCAVREVLEETGYDLDKQINQDDVVEFSIKEQSISLYIVPDVPEDFPFETRTRKEISKIQWFKLSDLPTWKRNKVVPGKFYLITPFIGPLRTFIREKKPRDLRRKGPKTQVQFHQSDAHVSSDEDGTGPVDTNSLLPTDPSTQESSSQSSSADNGEPQTPSPQYSEPPLNTVTGIATYEGETGVQQTLDLGNVDPSLARLLTSLSLSASTVSVGKATIPPVSSLPPVVESRADVVSPTPPSHTSTARTSRPSRTPSAGPRSAQTSPMKMNASKASSVSSPNAQLPSPPSTAPLSASSPSLIQGSSVPVSPLSPAHRHNPFNPSVSPYFTKATPAPTIPKHIKYLTMLESVAKESERMTPTLEQMQFRNSAGHGIHGPPLPSLPSGPYPPPISATRGDPVIYSSGPGAPSLPYGYPPNSIIPPNALPSMNPLAVRPHTSLSRPGLYPSHLPRASMNDGQMRYMMAGISPRPPTAHAMGGPPLFAHHIPAYAYPPPFPPVSQTCLPIQGGLRVMPPFAPQRPGPKSPPALSPTFNLPARTNPAHNAHLLSILNNPNAPPIHPNQPPTASPAVLPLHTPRA